MPSSPLTTPLVDGLSYLPNFLSPPDHDALATSVSTRGVWKRLHARSLQNHGGLPHARGMVATPLPPHLALVAASLVAAAVFPPASPPNHVLVNRYLAGQGIDAHEDGPVFLPCAAILSLESAVVMDFYKKETRQRVCSLCLEPRSLLVIEGEAYTDFLHGIEARDVDRRDSVLLNTLEGGGESYERRRRTSLTLRRSSKTLKFKL